MKVEVHEKLIFVTISQSNTIDIQILIFLINLLFDEVDEWIRRLPAMQGIAGSIPAVLFCKKS